MFRKDDYTKRNLLDYPYHQSYYKRISVDWSRQTSAIISWKINFTDKLEEDINTKIFFIAENFLIFL